MTPETTTRQRILIIEDNLDTAHTLAFLLRRSGHDAEYAINGYAALAIAESWRPHVVFIDIGLPDFDGCALVRRLRRLPDLENTRYIAISGRESDDDQDRAKAAGCEQFLRKPVAPQMVERIIGAARPVVGLPSDSINASPINATWLTNP